MLGFFSQNRGVPDVEPVRRSNLVELVRCVARLCQGPDSHPFARPLGVTFAQLGEAAAAGVVDPAALEPVLAAAVEFLLPSESPTRLLEFALSAHTEKAATERFFQSVAEALTSLHHCSDFLADWLRCAEDFADCCLQVWELHAYFVFLDIKGDRSLFEQTAHRLCAALQCSMRSFVGCLAHARLHVEDVLRLLRRQEMRPLLERLHEDALCQWQSSWQDRIREAPERARFVEEAQNDNKFWESYFTHLLKITWPDFLEAFEHFYLLGRCPVDIVNQLRASVDPTLRHQVLRSTWQRLLQQHGRILNVIDALVGNVLSDLGSCVYRPEPLRFNGGALSSSSCPADSLEESPDRSSETAENGGATASSGTPSPSSPRTSHRGPASRKSVKPTPWFPFAHSGSGDADMMIATPHDLRVRQGTAPDHTPEKTGPQVTVAWDDFVARLCAKSRPWWNAPSEELPYDSAFDDSLRVAALRAVSSSIAFTQRALVFRVVSGDLAQSRPALELPRPDGDAPEKEDLLPSLIIRATGTRCNGITKFGRTSSRRTLLPDCPMGEPIASRSHFNVVYMQDQDRYCLMDAGSKWGTFIKIGTSMPLSCGDWIRVGGVEFIIRFCGGGIACTKRHDHYRLHGLRLLKQYQGVGRPDIPRPPRLRSQSFGRSPERPTDRGEDASSSSDDEDANLLEDELLLLLNSRRQRGWTTASARLCQRSALHNAVPLTTTCRSFEAATQTVGALRTASSSSSAPAPWLSVESQGERLSEMPTPVPIVPLELDFISGPRMGEKLVLTERVCTLGRGEGNTIQVNDSQLASVSRVHCIFEYRGNSWHIRDNGSTNGTWRRLSCILEPSEPIPLCQGVSIQAGAHEFFVEEATMNQSWFPSAALVTLEELCEQERHMKQVSYHRKPEPDTGARAR